MGLISLGSLFGKMNEESPAKTEPTAVQHLAGIVTDSAAQVMQPQPQPPLMPPPIVEPPTPTELRDYAQYVTSLTPQSVTDVAVQNYWGGILPNSNDNAQKRAEKMYKIRERLRRGVPSIMMQLSQNQQQAHRNNLSTFGQHMVERWNAVGQAESPPPEVEVPQWTITSREEWGGITLDWLPNNTPKNTIVVHHTFPIELGADAQRVETSQTAGEFSSVAYNYLIGKNGEIYQGRDLFTRGVHDENRRYGSVGIALIGSFNVEEPTQPQRDALVWLIGDLQNRFPGITSIAPHWDDYACPGAWFREFRQEQGWNQ